MKTLAELTGRRARCPHTRWRVRTEKETSPWRLAAYSLAAFMSGRQPVGTRGSIAALEATAGTIASVASRMRMGCIRRVLACGVAGDSATCASGKGDEVVTLPVLGGLRTGAPAVIGALA